MKTLEAIERVQTRQRVVSAILVFLGLERIIASSRLDAMVGVEADEL